MLALSLEQDRHAKRHNGPEADPPRKCHHRKPVRLRISGYSENPRDVVRQSAQDGDDGEAQDQSPKSYWHLIENEMAECLVRSPGQGRIGMGLIVNPEQ